MFIMIVMFIVIVLHLPETEHEIILVRCFTNRVIPAQIITIILTITTTTQLLENCNTEFILSYS